MTHVHEDIGAFVLGALDDDSEKRVREHLATCPECAAAHSELAGIPGLLDLAVVTGATDEEPLPPAIEERLLDRFARERVERPAAAALAAADRVRRRQRAGGRRDRGGGPHVGLNFEKNGGRPASQYRLAFSKLGPAPANASARAGLRTSQAGTVVRLWVNNLPAGDVYEVLCDAPGWSASAGTFRVDAKGDAYVVLTTAVKKGQYDRIRLVRREHLASGEVKPYDILGAKLLKRRTRGRGSRIPWYETVCVTRGHRRACPRRRAAGMTMNPRPRRPRPRPRRTPPARGTATRGRGGSGAKLAIAADPGGAKKFTEPS